MDIHNNVEIRVVGPDGTLKNRIKSSNIITNVGLTRLPRFITDSGYDPFNYVYVGGADGGSPPSVSPPAATDTTLEYPITFAGHVNPVSFPSTGKGRFDLQIGVSASPPEFWLVELGIFDESGGTGIMLARVTPTPVYREVRDVMYVTWDIYFA